MASLRSDLLPVGEEIHSERSRSDREWVGTGDRQLDQHYQRAVAGRQEDMDSEPCEGVGGREMLLAPFFLDFGGRVINVGDGPFCVTDGPFGVVKRWLRRGVSGNDTEAPVMVERDRSALGGGVERDRFGGGRRVRFGGVALRGRVGLRGRWSLGGRLWRGAGKERQDQREADGYPGCRDSGCQIEEQNGSFGAPKSMLHDRGAGPNSERASCPSLYRRQNPYFQWGR